MVTNSQYRRALSGDTFIGQHQGPHQGLVGQVWSSDNEICVVSSAGFSPLGLYSVKMNLNKLNRAIDFFFPLPYFSVLLVIEKEKKID